jgi:type I restriction enzyme S subunit
MKVDVIGDTEDFITSDAVVNSATKLVDENSILMVVRSGILKHTFPVALSDRDVTINQDMRALTPLDGIEARYLAFALRRLQRHILDECSKDGTTVASVEPALLEQVWVPIPPTAEQQRIVARIDELFTEIADGETTLTRARDDLETWRRALLKAAVTGELTREWREHSKPNETGEDVVERLRQAIAQAFGAVARFGRRMTVEDQIEVDVANLPELPPGWCWSRIGEIGHVSGGLTKNPARAEIDRKLPFLRVANVQYGDLDLTEMHEIGVSNSELDRVLLQQNDLLIVEGNGSVDQIGRCAIWTGEIVPCVHQNHLIKARFVDAEIAQWAYHWLMSPHGRQLVTTVASSTSGLHTLSISKIQAIPVPVPPFIEIVEILKVLSAETDAEGTIETELSTGSKTIDPLRQAILKAAFEGRLVEQDRSEEPADCLLARLNECPPQARNRARRSRSIVEANA